MKLRTVKYSACFPLQKKTLFLIGSGGRSFNASACAVGTTWLLGQSLIAEMGFYMLFSTFEAVFYKSQSFTRLPKTFVICDMWSLSHSVIAPMRTINSETLQIYFSRDMNRYNETVKYCPMPLVLRLHFPRKFYFGWCCNVIRNHFFVNFYQYEQFLTRQWKVFSLR